MSMTLTLNKGTDTVKILYSYGGKILPRRSDGKLCYVGGHTRILSVDRSVTYSELMVKFGELCGSSMNLKCKLPNEDLDVLVSITSNGDLASIIDEYDKYSSSSSHKDLKIRAVLFPIKSLKKVSPPISIASSCVTSARRCRIYSPLAGGLTTGDWKPVQSVLPSLF